MKKGSESRKCSQCKQIVLWFVPTGKYGLFGEPELELKTVKPWVTRKGIGYCCKECFKKMNLG